MEYQLMEYGINQWYHNGMSGISLQQQQWVISIHQSKYCWNWWITIFGNPNEGKSYLTITRLVTFGGEASNIEEWQMCEDFVQESQVHALYSKEIHLVSHCTRRCPRVFAKNAENNHAQPINLLLIMATISHEASHHPHSATSTSFQLKSNRLKTISRSIQLAMHQPLCFMVNHQLWFNWLLETISPIPVPAAAANGLLVCKFFSPSATMV